jgi:hypothetical protein
MKSSPYRPGQFSSLTKSCYDSDFYMNIKNIPFLRALVFLFLFSLIIAAVALVTLAFFWSRLFPTQDAFVKDFQEQFPEVQVTFDGETLVSEPADITLFLGFDESARLRLLKERPYRQALRLQVNSSRPSEEALLDPPQALGVYLYQDALYLQTGFQTQAIPYETFEFDKQLSFDKSLLSIFIESGFPIAQEWLKNLLLITGPMMIFFYHFLGSWILALLFSLFGTVVLLLTKKRIHYFFLIKLSFYSSVPALLIALSTAFFGLSVPFVPLLVYVAFYGYGLHVYEG